jgi:competence protein ComEC
MIATVGSNLRTGTRKDAAPRWPLVLVLATWLAATAGACGSTPTAGPDDAEGAAIAAAGDGGGDGDEGAGGSSGVALAEGGGAEFLAAAPADAGDGTLEIHFVDVGQGDGIFIVTPERRVVVIDAGTARGGRAMMRSMRRRGVQRVDLALISHSHADHIGGFRRIFNRLEVAHYGDPGFEHPSNVYASLLEKVEEEGSDGMILTAGDWLRIDPEVELYVLAPSTDYLTGTRSDVNANSMVLLLRYRDLTVLFMGDAELDTERRLLSGGWLVDVDVLKVAHHGSAHASSPPFLRATTPEVAVISCGAGNSYGHPAPETVDRLDDFAHDGIFRTDLLGDVVLFSDGERYWIESTDLPDPVGDDGDE